MRWEEFEDAAPEMAAFARAYPASLSTTGRVSVSTRLTSSGTMPASMIAWYCCRSWALRLPWRFLRIGTARGSCL